MAKIAPDGGSGIDEGIRLILEGFGICLTAMVEEESIHTVTENESTKQAGTV